MKEVLVITGWYLPILSANGACLDSVLKELSKKGYYAHVVSFAKEDIDYSCEYCTVYPVITKKETASGGLINKIRTTFDHVIRYPLFNKELITSAYNKCVELMNRYNIEMVLCVQWPASAGYVGCKLKEVFSEKKYILYALDSLTDNIHNYQSWTKFFSYKNTRLEREILDKYDLMMYLACHKEYYNKAKYKLFENKMVPVDVPLIEKEVYSKSRSTSDAGTRKLVYSGILLKETRSPEYLVKLFAASISNGLDTSLHFYSRGDCEEALKNYAETELQGNLFVHGYVSKEELDEILGGSDVLVSIGNPKSDKVFSMPSKFLYYMSLGKAILHIALDEYDMCIPYLARYPKALVLYEKGDFAQNVSKLVSFVQSLDGCLVDFEFIAQEFIENTPAYTAKMMIR